MNIGDWYNEIILYVQLVMSPLTDIIIFLRLLKPKKLQRTDYCFAFLLVVGMVWAMYQDYSNLWNFVANALEFIGLYLYFGEYRKYRPRLQTFGALAMVFLFDLAMTIIGNMVYLMISLADIYRIETGFNFLIELLVIFAVPQSFYDKLHRLLTDENHLLLITILAYIDISGEFVIYFAFQTPRMNQVLEISLGLLILQTLFALIGYGVIIRIQRQIRQENEQKQMELERDNLKEYSAYLEQNEEELRRFKHDYKNMFNSLKISARQGDMNSVIDQLDRYTQTQFNDKALRKYKGVNNVHNDLLKSLLITKLSEMYSLGLSYSFGCQKAITKLPADVDEMDVVRIMGITFDNAIEESQLLLKNPDLADQARVDVMLYTEDGDFEFEIRNRVHQQNIQVNRLKNEGYTTKQNHAGLGLNNVMRIARKYEQNMLIDYGVEDGWFTFDLTIVPNEVGEE
ncbi:GHKL domain-containing protein [Lactobacillus corticis]|uniref:Histidine kinase n=1 Tax=Lactobacillus corticis TaxID=2201249 RepID=A0A916VHL2_9LACO|nr:GHKL domain-containing protein [Lactobacillus corticis]GFZ27181.1 histidine kinase [Lactobacillus corticis]